MGEVVGRLVGGIPLWLFVEPDRPMLSTPWSDRGHSYATNGKIIVRIPRADDALSDREDMDPIPPSIEGDARRLAYADNRVGEVDYDLDGAVLLADLESGMDVGGLYEDWELDAIRDKLDDAPGDGDGGGNVSADMAAGHGKITFMLPDDDLHRLRKHLSELDKNKNTAMVQWLDLLHS